jgi:pimeloyl-ACP methyl ester carboxylesterase
MKKQLTIKDKNLAYLDKGQGEVLLFGHSYLCDHSMWLSQVDKLSQHYRCIAPDLWGHGTSDSLPACFASPYDFAEHMITLMDHLAVERFSVIGHSIGGMWGTKLAANHPERVKSLVLMGTYLGDEPETSRVLYFGLMDQIDQEQCVSKEMAQTITPFYFAPQSIDRALPCVQTFSEQLQSLSIPQLSQLTQMGRALFSRPNGLELLGKITAPVLLLTGEEDLPRPVRESEEMMNYLKRGKLDVIPNAGHLSALEQPEFINEKLKNFFARVL